MNSRKVTSLKIKEIETIQTTDLLRSAIYKEESRRPEKSCCHSDFSERPSTNAGLENSQGV